MRARSRGPILARARRHLDHFAQREDDPEALRERTQADGLNEADYEWYLDLRRYGTVPHGGFGLGVERTVAWICGLKHIRETIPYARMMGRIYP